jgi:hypothetical protein
MVYALSTHESELRLSWWYVAEMLGKAMLTMKRSSEDRKTPVRTIRAVRTGRARCAPRGGFSISSVMQCTVEDRVA